MEPLATDDPVEIAGYRLRARLGAGGMGRVYLAFTAGGRPVALKIVRPELGDDEDFRRRFRQEVTAARLVNGLYTAQVLDADPDARPPWLVTAYVPGPSLQQAVAEHGPLPPQTVLVLIAGVAEALQVIHGVGLVHRDLKPSNVLLAADGPRVIDFGIARAADGTMLTRTGLAIGSPGFMAPEQVEALPVTPAVDVFALGCVAAYAATGRGPFGEGSSAAMLYRVINQPPDLTGCSPALRGLIERCLAKTPAQRLSPGQVIDECRAQAAGHTLQIPEAWLPAAVSADLAGHLPPAAAPPGQAAPRFQATPPYQPTQQPQAVPQARTEVPPSPPMPPYQPTATIGQGGWQGYAPQQGYPAQPGQASGQGYPAQPGQPGYAGPPWQAAGQPGYGGPEGYASRQATPPYSGVPGGPTAYPGGPGGTTPPGPRRVSRGVLIGGVAALIVAAGVGGGVAVALSHGGGSGGGGANGATTSPSAHASAAASPRSTAGAKPVTTKAKASPPPNPASCLVGTWKTVDQQVINTINGQQVVFTGSGPVSTLLANGSITTNYDGATYSANVNGNEWTETIQGVASGHWALDNGTILYSDLTSSGTEVLDENGVYNNSGPLQALPESVPYQCSGNTLRESFPTGGSDQLTRVTPS